MAIDGGFSTADLYTYEVDDNGVYSVDEATASNGAAQGEITAMNNSYLTVGDLEDYDVSDATIIDLRNGDEIDASPVDEITSVTALRRAVNNEDVDEVTVSVVYDSDDATISYVFVESVTAAGD